MAQGYLETVLKGQAEVYSAGVEAHGLNPWAVRVMSQAGIDITGHTSNLIDEYIGQDFDFIITVCDHAKENCPVFPAKTNQIHHNFPDPANANGTAAELEKIYSDVRDLIAAFVDGFAKEYFERVNSPA